MGKSPLMSGDDVIDLVMERVSRLCPAYPINCHRPIHGDVILLDFFDRVLADVPFGSTVVGDLPRSHSSEDGCEGVLLIWICGYFHVFRSFSSYVSWSATRMIPSIIGLCIPLLCTMGEGLMLGGCGMFPLFHSK